jgi:hypothetical protein
MKVFHMAEYALCIGINDYPGTGSDFSGYVYDAIRKCCCRNSIRRR